MNSAVVVETVLSGATVEGTHAKVMIGRRSSIRALIGIHLNNENALQLSREGWQCMMQKDCTQHDCTAQREQKQAGEAESKDLPHSSEGETNKKLKRPIDAAGAERSKGDRERRRGVKTAAEAVCRSLSPCIARHSDPSRQQRSGCRGRWTSNAAAMPSWGRREAGRQGATRMQRMRKERGKGESVARRVGLRCGCGGVQRESAAGPSRS